MTTTSVATQAGEGYPIGPSGVERPRPRRAVVRHLVGLLGLLALADVAVGYALPPVVVGASTPITRHSEIVQLGRLVLAVAVAVVLLFGPGLVLRGAVARARFVPLGFVALPGMALLVVTSLAAWYASADPHTVVRLILTPVLAVLAYGLWRVRPALLDVGERQIGVLGLAVFGIGLGRALWPWGPTGELFGGTIARTLEVGDRSDPRISYAVTSLVGDHLNAYTGQGNALFWPYTFSDRGPLPGLISAPVMLLSGATPTDQLPFQRWMPFDPEGYAVYRIVMMLLALTALAAVYTVTRTAFGPRAAGLAAVVTAGTPFFVHDVYFTWPKFAAAAMCLLAAHLILRHHPLAAGVFVGLGFLMHPLALLSVPTLLVVGLAVIVRDRRAREAPPRALLAPLWACVGVGLVALAWRGINTGHYSQGAFLHYVLVADGVGSPSISLWLDSRTVSLANTLVPLRLPLVDGSTEPINQYYGNHMSSGVVHFFFQYWNTLPFGGAIVFFPVLLIGLVAAARRRLWLVLGVAVMPLLLFTAYWGSFTTGLLREGLHPWVLGLLVLWAAAAEPVLRRRRLGVALRVVLLLRLVEVALMLVVPTLTSPRTPQQLSFGLITPVGLILMAGGLLVLARQTWAHPNGPADRATVPVPAEPATVG